MFARRKTLDQPAAHPSGIVSMADCVCAYTWSDTGIVRNGPRADCPAHSDENRADVGYDLLAVRIRRGTTINGAIVALCPDSTASSPPTYASTARRSRDQLGNLQSRRVPVRRVLELLSDDMTPAI